MKKRMKACIRRDKKRRILRAGETVRADGRYQFKYTVDGKIKFFYSWKLEPTDHCPQEESLAGLREMEDSLEVRLVICPMPTAIP